MGVLGGEGSSGAKVLQVLRCWARREARARGKGRKIIMSAWNLEKCGGLGGGSVS